MKNNNKAIAIVVGAVAALFAISFVVRFVMLSEYGVSGSWMYFGLPFGGIGLVVLLMRLGLFGSGQRSGGTIAPLHYNSGPPLAPMPVAPVSQRLQQLDGMRSSGAISEAEYNAKREQIISTI